jgi:hypothetical protein
MSPNAGGEGCGVLANEYRCAHGAQISFGNLTPYLTYDYTYRGFILIPSFSAFRFNDLEYAWVGESNWTYTARFAVDPALLARQAVLQTLFNIFRPEWPKISAAG